MTSAVCIVQGQAVQFAFGVQAGDFSYDMKHSKHAKCINHTWALSQPSCHGILLSRGPRALISHCHSVRSLPPRLFCAGKIFFLVRLEQSPLLSGTQEMQRLTFPASFAARVWALLLGGFVLTSELGGSSTGQAVQGL